MESKLNCCLQTQGRASRENGKSAGTGMVVNGASQDTVLITNGGTANRMMELMSFVDAVTNPNRFQRQVCKGRDSVKGKSKHSPGKGVVCLIECVMPGGIQWGGEGGVLKQRINPFRALPNSPRPAASPSQRRGK